MSARNPHGAAGAAGGLELHVLGSVSLAVDGVPLALGSRKALALVARLALDGPLARGELAELLWGDLGPGAARSNLRKTLHMLRDTSLAEHLEVGGPLISCRAAQVDATDFERLTLAGAFGPALEVGTGVLLGGLDFGSDTWNEWLEVRRARHAGLERQARLGLAAQREAQGDLRGALDLVTQLLDLDAYDEPAVREAMRLQLSLGERHQATAMYGRFRTLTAPLNLEPEPATQALAARAHREDQAPVSAASPARTATLRSALVGREAAWLQLSRTEASLCVLVGEAGVGKTRLATDFAAAQGAGPLMRGREETRFTPFYPVAQLIREALDARLWSPAGLEDVWRHEVARLVPECAPGSVPPAAAEAGRARFLEGLARAVTGVLAGQLLVLDDLHWFDEDTLELVAHIVRRTDAARFLATARAAELEHAPPVRRTLDSLRRDGLADTFVLEPLAEAEVLAMVQSLSGAGGGTLFSRRLHGASGGNPLYLLELLRGLLESGTLAPAAGGGWETPYDESTLDYAELPIPPSLRDTVLERVGRLGPTPRRLLEGAALAGESFESAWLSGLEVNEFTRLDALEAACRAEVLEPDSSGFRFRHELLRRALDESLGQDRRRALHGALAAQLQAAQAAPERVAHHLEGAGTPEDAVPYLERAAEAAASVYAFGQALTYTERMLDHERDDTRRWYFERRRLWFLSLITDAATYEEHLARFGALAERSGDPNRRAEVYFMRGLFHLLRSEPAELSGQAEAMLSLPGLSTAARVNTLYIAGHAHTLQGRCARALDNFAQALELRRSAEGAGASISAVNIENGLTRACLTCGEFGQAAEHNASALEQLRGVNDISLIYTLNWQGHLAALVGRFGPAREAFGLAAERAARRRDMSALSTVLRHRAALLLALGESGAALDDIAEVGRCSEGQFVRVEAIGGGLRAEALFLQGKQGEALDAAHAAISALERAGVSGTDPALAELRGTLAGLLIDCGDLPAALTELNAAQALDDASDGLSVRLSRAARATAAARIERATGQPARALKRLRETSSLEHTAYGDRVAHAAELARALMLTGDPADALGQLKLLEPTPPLLPSMLNVQLAAQLVLGQVPDEVLGRAMGVLDLDTAAPTDRLELMATVIRVLDGAGRDAAPVRALARATLTALLDSLSGYAAARAGLLRRFPTVLEV